MEVKKLWIVLVICFLIIGLAGVFLYYYFHCPKVILNLPRPPIDGEKTWAFLVNGKERNPGDVIVVWKSLKIDVVELEKGKDVSVDSGKIIDSFKMNGIIQNGDLLAYKYFSEESNGEESLAVVDYHQIGSATFVFVDLQKEEKPWIIISSIPVEIMDRWTILVNGKEIDNDFYPYRQGDEVILSIKEIKSGKIVGETNITGNVEEYAQIYWRYEKASGLTGEEEFFIILNTPSDKSFIYDIQEIKVNIFSLTL